MKPKKKSKSKKAVRNIKKVDPNMLKRMAEMQQMPNEEQGEQGMDNEMMEGGMGGGIPPRNNYKGKMF